MKVQSEKNIVLVVAAHADDEVLGCGGTLARHRANGDEVSVVFMTDGVGSRSHSSRNEEKMRLSAAHTALKNLSIKDTHQLSFPDNKMDTVPLLEIVKSVEKILKKIKPTLIYTNHNGDLNIDHQITQRAVLTACRPEPKTSVKNILSFEVLSSTEWGTPNVLPFTPNHFVDISSRSIHDY